MGYCPWPKPRAPKCPDCVDSSAGGQVRLRLLSELKRPRYTPSAFLTSNTSMMRAPRCGPSTTKVQRPSV